MATGESARMLAALNEAAEQTARTATRRLTADIDALLAGDLRSAQAANIERAGRARLSELAVSEAEAWREEQTLRLEDGLARLDERLAADLRAELDAVREAAASLLGLALTVPGPGHRVMPDLRFFYVAGQDAGQTELLAGAMRRHLPGEAGRRRVRDYLRRETARLVPQQIGRARSDLQYRLAEATRRLIRDVETRYADSTSRLESALRIATAKRQSTAGEAAEGDAKLGQRQEKLGRLLRLLDDRQTGSPSAHER